VAGIYLNRNTIEVLRLRFYCFYSNPQLLCLIRVQNGWAMLSLLIADITLIYNKMNFIFALESCVTLIWPGLVGEATRGIGLDAQVLGTVFGTRGGAGL
jgi:hypothetical protein